MRSVALGNLQTITPDRFSASGKWAFVVSLLFVFSISIDYRLNILGLLIHPFLMLLPLAIFFTNFTIFRIPSRVLTPLLIFLVIFSVASLQNSRPSLEILKVIASIITFLFFATAVKTERDFRFISLGIIACAVTIGYLAFQIGPVATQGVRLDGINALEGLGNKNAQSLFTLPGLFLSILLVVRSLRNRNYILAVALIAGLFFIVVSIFLSANRSGWVGLGVIMLVYFFFFRLSLNLVLITSILFFFSYLGIDRYASDIVGHKTDQTLEGYKSDEGRMILIEESLRVGIENPLLGVGMDELHRELNKYVQRSSIGPGKTDSHFLIGYLFGATGVFSLFFFLFFLWRLVKKIKIPRLKRTVSIEDPWVLLVGFVILFLIRSAFTREILYSPTFMGTMGLLYGYYLLTIRKLNVRQG